MRYFNRAGKVIPIANGRFLYVVEVNGAGVAYFNNFDNACLYLDEKAGLL